MGRARGNAACSTRAAWLAISHLFVAIAISWAVSTGLWDVRTHALADPGSQETVAAQPSAPSKPSDIYLSSVRGTDSCGDERRRGIAFEKGV